MGVLRQGVPPTLMSNSPVRKPSGRNRPATVDSIYRRGFVCSESLLASSSQATLVRLNNKRDKIAVNVRVRITASLLIVLITRAEALIVGH